MLAVMNPSVPEPQTSSPQAAISPQHGVIEVHVAELKRFFNEMDPAPFRDRDLDPKAEEFIVDSSREFRSDRPLALIVHLDQQPGTAAESEMLREAVHAYFLERAIVTRRRLRQLFRVGRKSLLIAVIFLGVFSVLGDQFFSRFGREGYAGVLREGLVILGWVALWRPLEIFLYDWWPIQAEAKLYDRLSTMLVQIVNARPAVAVAEPVRLTPQ
jgi:hypothetical protein